MFITKAEKRMISIITSILVFATSFGLPSVQVLAADQVQDAVVTEGTVVAGQVEAAGDILVYEFTPDETASYAFASSNSGDTYGSILDQNQNVVYTDNDGGEDLGFRMKADLTAGETYYLQVSFFSEDETGEIDWSIAKDLDAKDLDAQDETVEDVQEEQPAEVQEAVSEQETVEPQAEADYKYAVLPDNTVKITKYKGSEADVSIPATIDGKTVTVIGKSAFASNATMTSLSIPNTVTKTEYMSIADCTSLARVTFAAGSKLTTLGTSTFLKSALTSIELPDSVTTIEDNVFSMCSFLTNVKLGHNVKTIGSYAFALSGIQSIVLPDSLQSMEASCFWSCQNLKSVTLGTGLSTIPEAAFGYCSSLGQITFPDNITSIENGAFRWTGLISVNLPDSVVSIGENAFSDCKSLTKAVIGNKIAYISKSAFASSKLEEVTIGNNVKVIQDYAFKDTSLKNVNIPSSVTELQYGVFQKCSDLSDVTIPDSVAKIGGRCFYQTKWLENQADGMVYAGKVAYLYKGTMPADTEIKFKDGTLGIAAFAFENKKNLKAVEIPGTVTNIGTFAFYDCPEMTSVYIPSSVTEIGDHALGYYDDGKRDQIYIIYDYSVGAQCAKVDGFTIKGAVGTAAEKYAKDNGFTFEEYVPLTSIEMNRSSAKLQPGDTTTLSVRYDAEDTTMDKTVTWSSSNAGVVAVDQNGKITADQTGKATITATVGTLTTTCEISVVEKVFDDVSEGQWFEKPIAYVNANGLMTGLNASEFGAGNNLARAQFATILYRIEGAPSVEYTSKFPDVAEGLFYSLPVLWANSKGIVTGYTSNGCFGPSDNITREQMAVMMYRYAIYKGYNVDVEADLTVFPDSKSVSGFAIDAMKWAVGTKLITGDNDKINPQGTANRAVCATIIMRFMQNTNHK